MNIHAQRKSILAGPLYLQVSEILRQRIIDAKWPVGQPIPNEDDLAREVGVSKGTLRKALELLEDDHLIVRRQGRGTFVAQTSIDAELDRFSNLLCGDRKLRDHATTVTARPGPLTTEEAQALRLSPGEPVHRYFRLFRIARKATIAETLTLPRAQFLDFSDKTDLSAPLLFSVYRLHHDVSVASATESVSAYVSDAALSQQMGIAEKTPLLRIERIALSTLNVPVELSVRYIQLEQAKYTVRF